MRFSRLPIVLLAVVAGLGAGELILRLLLPPPHYSLSGDPANQLPGLLVAHPRRGYAHSPGFVGEIRRDGRRVRVSVNQLGLRSEELTVRPTAPLILAAGDSFTVGFGVEADEAWPQRLAEHLRRRTGKAPRVANAGVSGYSLRQVRLTVEELQPRLEPALVVVGVYSDAVWRIENPYVLFDGQLVNRATLPRLARVGEAFIYSPYENLLLRKLHHWTGRYFIFGYHLLRVPPALAHRSKRLGDSAPTQEQTARRLAPLLVELDRLDANLRRYDTALAVLLINPPAAEQGFEDEQKRLNDIVAKHLRERGIVVVDPLSALAQAAENGSRLRFTNDHHWSPTAHDVAAASLADGLIHSGLWPAGRP